MSKPPQPLQSIPELWEVAEVMDGIISYYRNCNEQIVRNVTPATATFDNVVRPLVEAADKMYADTAVLTCLSYAAFEKKTHAAVREAFQRLSGALSEMRLQAQLFPLLRAVELRAEPLDSESRKLLADELRDYTATGHGILSPELVREYSRRRDEIDDLRRQFNDNLRYNNEGIWFTEDQLVGLEEHQITSFTKGTEEPNIGKRFVPFKKADNNIIMRYAENPATRKTMYLADQQKLAQNVPIFSKVMQLRDINARLLGRKNHAAFRLERRMAKSTEWVDDFLTSMKSGLGPLVEKDIAKLHVRKKAHLAMNPAQVDHDCPKGFHPWDFGYYTRMAEKELHVEEEKLAEYFPLEYTVQAMLRIFTACLGIVFKPIPKPELHDKIWWVDVDVYSVWEGEDGPDAGAFIGYLYTDLLWRENKVRGNQDVNLQRGYEKPDGSRVYPATVLMCSFSPSTSTECPLLQHNQVVTLFHELGHGIHDLLSKTKHTRFHSYNGAMDFGEAPSVFLENFCWLRDEIRDMSCHYTRLQPEYLADWRAKHPGLPDPPDKIPDDVLDNLIAKRSLNLGWLTADRLAVAIFDLKIHSPDSHQDLINLDITKLYNDVLEDLTCVRNPDPQSRGHPHVHFGHLMIGYDVNYYAYSWALVFATDVFETAFARDPRDRKVWERYRRIVLKPGGSTDELKLAEEFLGRPLSPEALFRRLGLGQ